MFERPGLYNADCMEAMREFPAGFFDIAIVDPPYNIPGLQNRKTEKSSRLRKYGDVSQANNEPPKQEYFDELLRVSKNAIVWGGNYFPLPPCRCFLVWYKHQPVVSYSDCELAWTSYDRPAKVIDLPYFGAVGRDRERIHPTQKPVRLYEKILEFFADENTKILDTHAGSASSLIACERRGIQNAWGFEIDPEYYRKATERMAREREQLAQEKAQISMFDQA